MSDSGEREAQTVFERGWCYCGEICRSSLKSIQYVPNHGKKTDILSVRISM